MGGTTTLREVIEKEQREILAGAIVLLTLAAIAVVVLLWTTSQSVATITTAIGLYCFGAAAAAFGIWYALRHELRKHDKEHGTGLLYTS